MQVHVHDLCAADLADGPKLHLQDRATAEKKNRLVFYFVYIWITKMSEENISNITYEIRRSLGNKRFEQIEQGTMYRLTDLIAKVVDRAEEELRITVDADEARERKRTAYEAEATMRERDRKRQKRMRRRQRASQQVGASERDQEENNDAGEYQSERVSERTRQRDRMNERRREQGRERPYIEINLKRDGRDSTDNTVLFNEDSIKKYFKRKFPTNELRENSTEKIVFTFRHPIFNNIFPYPAGGSRMQKSVRRRKKGRVTQRKI